MGRGPLCASGSRTRVCRSFRQGMAAWSVAVLVLATFLPATPASAHTYLLSSDPTGGGTVDAVPEQVTLEFTDQVELEFADVTVSVSGGPAYGALTESEGTSLIVRIPPGAATSQPGNGPATWKLAYRVTAGDGHPVNEGVSFTVSPGSRAAAVSKAPDEKSKTGLASGAWSSEARPRHIPGWALLSLGSLTAAAVLAAVPALRRQANRARR